MGINRMYSKFNRKKEYRVLCHYHLVWWTFLTRFCSGIEPGLGCGSVFLPTVVIRCETRRRAGVSLDEDTDRGGHLS